jgi:hypothetical protein
VLTALLFLLPITGGLVTHTLIGVQESKQFSNEVNGYVEPKWLGYQIGQAQDSLVTVDCSGSFGSGFSFNLDETDRNKGFAFEPSVGDETTTHIITNAHVIENCGNSGPRIIIADGSIGYARTVQLDVENDLALLDTSLDVPPLYGTYTSPYTGFWVMALGSPHKFAGSVTYGNIINHDSKLIFTTASLSPGNSGGPLIDNSGYVFGVNSGSKPVGQNFNISIGINVFCEKLIICPAKRFWQEE